MCGFSGCHFGGEQHHIGWSEKASVRTWFLNNGKEITMYIFRKRALQTKRTTYAEALMWEWAWGVWVAGNRPLWLGHSGQGWNCRDR